MSDFKLGRLTRALSIVFVAIFLIAALSLLWFELSDVLVLLALTNGFGAFAVLVFSLGVIDKQLQSTSANDKLLNSWTYKLFPALSLSLLRIVYTGGQDSKFVISDNARRLFIASHMTFLITTLVVLAAN
jgi:hypothetical protein